MSDKKEIEPQQVAQIKNSWVIGVIFGLCIAWALGFYSITFSILSIILGIWVTPKMLDSKKSFVKVIFWILFILILILGVIGQGLRSSSEYFLSQDVKEPIILSTDKNPAFSQVSGNLYRNTKYHFRIKFPEGSVIKQGDGQHIVQKAIFESSTISLMIQQYDLGGSNGFSSIKDMGSVKEFIDLTIEGAKSKFSDVAVLNYGETKIDNQPSYWVEYSGSSQVLDQDINMTNLVYFIAKGDTIYSVSAGALTNEYEKYKPLFTQTISTFVLEN